VKPFEIFSENGKITKIPILGERINAEMVEDFASLKRSSTPSSYLICGSSMQLTLYGIESKSIDIVATDPPYFDFIQYSELANFFYVWLRIVLESRYSAFKSELISSYAELGSDKKPSQFLAGLTNVFKECYRVLKEKAPLVFTFHHSSDSAWGIILQSIFLSNFVVTAAYPIHSEFKARPTTGRNYDILLICRKRESLIKINTVSWKEIKEKVRKEGQIVQNCKNKETYKWEETFSNIIPLISSSLTPELLSDLNSDLKEVFSLLQ